jgi:hypothetical protein
MPEVVPVPVIYPRSEQISGEQDISILLNGADPTQTAFEVWFTVISFRSCTHFSHNFVCMCFRFVFASLHGQHGTATLLNVEEGRVLVLHSPSARCVLTSLLFQPLRTNCLDAFGSDLALRGLVQAL